MRIAFGQSVPPYIIEKNDSGIEMDIIREALAYKGHSIKIIYIPFIEILDVFAKDIADAAATVDEKIGIDGYFSNDVITYRNYAITLASSAIDIHSVWDLLHYRVSAFQLARKYMGKEFAQMAYSNPYYRERQNQCAHMRLLYQGKIDVVVSDKNIFLYYAHQHNNPDFLQEKVLYHDVFSPSTYKVIFKDKHMRDDFNEGLAHLKSNGRYQAIFDSYTSFLY